MIKNKDFQEKDDILFGDSRGQQGFINNFLQRINEGFQLSPSYYKVTKGIDDDKTLYDVWILDSEKAYKTDISGKRIIMKPGQNLSKGDYINWEGNIWLCTKKDSQKSYYDDGLIEICNKTLKYSYNGFKFELPCVSSKIGKNAMTLEENGNLIMSPNFYGIITVPYNNVIKKIPLNARFLFDEFAYKCIGKDSITFTEGIVELKIKQDSIRVGKDDFTTGYADNSELKSDNYTLKITNGNISSKMGDNLIQLNVQLSNNNIIQTSNKTDFIYQSDNEKICIIDSNGLVSFVGVGICNISALYKNDTTIKDSISITVEQANIPVIDQYTIAINGSDVIGRQMSSKANHPSEKYTAIINNNGVQDASKTVKWELFNLDGVTPMTNGLVNLTVLSNNMCEVFSTPTVGKFKLKAILSDDDTIFVIKKIEVTY